MDKNITKFLIIGRPNVGKSTLINKILKQRKVITVDEPGATRDINYIPAKWNEKSFLIADSGGVFLTDSSDIKFQNKIEEQMKKALKNATKVLFITDALEGLHPIDKSIATFLRKSSKKVILITNKVDNEKIETHTKEFLELGLGEPFCIATAHGKGVSNLLDVITKDVTVKEKWPEEYNNAYRISLIGRPNVGKSSLINALLNEEKMIVDEQSGTTRDSVESYFVYHKQKYIFVDTAGLRRRAKIKETVEYFSTLRSEESIESSHLVVILLDASELLTDQDKKIINKVITANKPFMIFINKWDLSPQTEEYLKTITKELSQRLPIINHIPILTGSAIKKLNINKIFQRIPEIIDIANLRITTSQLNQFIQTIIKKNPPSARTGEHIKIYYGTQVDTLPPHFIFFVNKPKLISLTYKRFVENRIRDYINKFEGTPIKISFRHHREEDR